MLTALFSSPFLSKALLGGIFLSISSALVGVPLVLKKNSMLADGLSHVSFGALALASILNLTPLPVALLASLVASFVILDFTTKENAAKISSDSKIAILSASALALGTLLTSLFGTNADLNSYLFGSILALKTSDLILSFALALSSLAVFFVFHHELFLVTFDETFARSIGLNVKLYDLLLTTLTSLVVVLGMRLFGTLLISCLIIFPAVSGKLLARGFHSLLALSVFFSLFAFLASFLVSYLFGLPTSSTVVLGNLIVLSIIYLYKCLSLN